MLATIFKNLMVIVIMLIAGLSLFFIYEFTHDDRNDVSFHGRVINKTNKNTFVEFTIHNIPSNDTTLLDMPRGIKNALFDSTEAGDTIAKIKGSLYVYLDREDKHLILEYPHAVD